MTATPNQAPDPSLIMQLGTGFMASRTLLSAVELGLFTALGAGALTRREIERAIGLHERSSADFLDALLSLGLLAREGSGDGAKYANTDATRAYLDKASPSYIGGILEMASRRLVHHWAHLTEGLRTGQPQNEIKTAKSKDDMFATLYSDPAALEGFVAAMASVQSRNFQALAENFDFSKHGTLCDAGGAGAALSIAVARRHASVRCVSLDLPQVTPIARRNVEMAGLQDRISLQAGDFFREPLPKAGVITMGNILHDWGLDGKKALIRKAYEALPTGGCFIAIENIIDDERRKNTAGLLMSLNMLIETEGGFDYTPAQFSAWCSEAGFRSTEILPLAGNSSAAIARK